MKYLFSDSRILIFAKEPLLGKVKTRLQPELGESGALALHCALITYQVNQLLASNLAPLELWVSSNPRHELFRGLVPTSKLFVQQGQDLGQRMDHAFMQTLKSSRTAVIVGADCPSVDADYLTQALSALKGESEAVFGPADDGGYVLVGLRERQPELFRNIPWGTSKVMSETQKHLRVAGLSTRILDSRWDVDRPEDLRRLGELDPPLTF
jgi:rSAM/selenodomain-associated transferase 1